MTAHHQHRWLAWLLPLIVLRSLLPAGFMLSWSSDGLQLVMCSGSGPMLLQAQKSIHADQQHSGQGSTGEHHEHQHSQVHENSICPFAAAATAGVLPTLNATTAFVANLSRDVLAPATQNLPTAPVLIERIRGPPALS